MKELSIGKLFTAQELEKAKELNHEEIMFQIVVPAKARLKEQGIELNEVNVHNLTQALVIVANNIKQAERDFFKQAQAVHELEDRRK